MTSSDDRHRLPGATLLRIAPLLFSEQFVSTVVHPTIADLQSEFAAAGESRARRNFAPQRSQRAGVKGLYVHGERHSDVIWVWGFGSCSDLCPRI